MRWPKEPNQSYNKLDHIILSEFIKIQISVAELILESLVPVSRRRPVNHDYCWFEIHPSIFNGSFDELTTFFVFMDFVYAICIPTKLAEMSARMCLKISSGNLAPIRCSLINSHVLEVIGHFDRLHCCVNDHLSIQMRRCEWFSALSLSFGGGTCYGHYYAILNNSWNIRVLYFSFITGNGKRNMILSMTRNRIH